LYIRTRKEAELLSEFLKKKSSEKYRLFPCRFNYKGKKCKAKYMEQ
jgi:hypothetical protein